MKRRVLLASVALFVCISYVYIVSVHRVQNLEDVQAVVDTLSLPYSSPRCRQANSSLLRCLPNVIMIGASKCGTTSLMDYLSHHTDVAFVNRRIHKVDKHREIHRFDRNTYGIAMKAVELADEWTSSPLVSSENTAVIHYTPHYVYAPTVPYEMKRFFPHASELKFIVMLREPVKRAWSSYWFHNSHLIQGVDRGSEQEFLQLARDEVIQRRTYEDCMNHELEALPLDVHTLTSGIPLSSAHLLYLYKLVHHISMLHNNTLWSAPVQVPVTTAGAAHSTPVFDIERILYSANKKCFGTQLRSPTLGTRHIDKGVYIDQILRWYASFKPSQFYIGTLEAFTAAPRDRFQDVLDFMAVPPTATDAAGTTSMSRNIVNTKAAGNGTADVHTTIQTGAGASASMQVSILPQSATPTHLNMTAAVGRLYDPVIDKLDFQRKRLERPNKLMPALSAVGTAELSMLHEFYKPYNDLLLLLGFAL